MKKNIRTMLSLLLVLALCFQCGGGLALADDVDVSVTGQEALVFELRMPDPGDPDSSIPVSAEEEAEKLEGKAYSIAVDGAILSRSPSGVLLGDLLTKDLIVTPPEGYYVARAYLRGDEVSSQQLKTLPFTAEPSGTRIALKAGAVANASNGFDKKYLTTGSHADPQVYTLALVFAPLPRDAAISVTEAMDSNDYGSQYTVMPGSAYTVPYSPGDTDQRVFAGWKLSYRSGAALMMEPGQSFTPYADCRLEAQWKQVITVSANAPYESDGQFYPNGWTYVGQLAEGDYFDSVALNVAEQADGFVAVPSDAVILNGGRNVTGNYVLRYENSYAVQKASVPEPTIVYLTIKANEPVSYDNGRTYESNGASLLEGSLNYGDGFQSIAIDVVRNDDGTYIAIPSSAVITNNGADVTGGYVITYLPSDPVTPPAPEKVKITIQAKAPITNDRGRTYESDGAILLEGSLNYGDSFLSIAIDVIRNDDGSYVAVPSNAVITNGSTYTTEDYEISYLSSDPIFPPEKVRITIQAKAPVTYDGGRSYMNDGAILLEGSLNYGDSFLSIVIDVIQNGDGSYTAVPSSAVITNGGEDVTEDYEISYLESESVTPPAPEKVKISVQAKEPVTNDRGRTYTADGAILAEGSLNEGDSFASVDFDIVRNDDGSYVATPKDLVIVRGAEDVTGDYEISYLPSSPVYPPEKIKITIRANDPVSYVSDGYTLTEGSLYEGDYFDSVQIDVQQDADGNYVAVPSDARILNGGVDFTDSYEISYLPSDPVAPPAPEKTKLSVQAKEPVTNDRGRTYTADGAILAEGSLNEGDSFASVDFDIIRNDDGSYVATPKDLVIVKGAEDVTEDYEISYLPSSPVYPPEKVKITIRANDPVSYVSDGYTLTEGSLYEGDYFDSVQIDVQQDADGNYVAVPSDARILNGGVDFTDSYEISYLPSDPVAPPAPEKTKLSVQAKEPVTNDRGRTYTANGAILAEGSLNEGDSFASVDFDIVRNDDGSYVAIPKDLVIVKGAEDVTEDYEISYLPSSPVFPPEKVKISIQAKAPVTNDGGKTFVSDGYTLAEGSLYEGDSIDSVQIDIQQNADGSTVAIPRDAVVKNGDADTTGDYEISYLPSSPVFPPEKVKISIQAKAPVTNDGGKTYVSDGYVLAEGSLNEGDRIDAVQIDVQQNADGSYVAVPRDAVIKNGDTDTTEGYGISYLPSESVTPPAPAEKTKLTIQAKEPVTNDGGKTYVHNGAVLLEGSLNAGDAFESIQYKVEKNENGNYVSTPYDAVISGGGIDNTANYDITYLPSGEVVPPAPEAVNLTVTALDQSWTYDGTSHKPDPSGYSVTGLVDEDKALVTLMVTQGENSGESALRAGNYSIVPKVTLQTKDGAPVPEGKYKLETFPGILIVKQLDITLEAESASKTYNGAPLVNDKVKAPPLPAGHMYQSVKLVYLDGSGKPVEGGVKDAGVYTKQISEVLIVDIGGQDVTSNYKITTVNGTFTIDKMDITMEAKSSSKFYDGTPLVDEKVTAPALPSGLSYQFVKLQYTDSEGKEVQSSSIKEVGVYTKKIVEVRIVDAMGQEVTQNFNITKVDGTITIKPRETVKLTITANEPVTNDGGKTYQPNNAVITEGALNPGDELRSVQIDVEKNADGDYVATPKDAVIKNGEIETTLNYEITYLPSKPVKPPVPEKIEITLRSKDRTAEYSGKLITADAYELVTGALAEGDTMELTYSGGSTNVTAVPVPSIISSVVIKDALGVDVTASKYAVTLDNDNAGKVTVTKHPITVTAISGSVETDGNTVIYAKNCKTSNNVFVRGHKVEGLLEGHELRGDFVKGYGTTTFTTSIDVNELRVYDTVNNIDVTANYQVNTVNGTMTIRVSGRTGVPVVVTVRDQSWTYDGTAHKPSTSGVDISGLLDGDTASITLKLRQGDKSLDAATNAGIYTIVPEVTIKTKDGLPVASNKYSVNIIGSSGTLTVKKLDVTLEAVSDSKAYDGKPLVNEKVKTPAPLPSGHKYQSVKLSYYNASGNLITGGVKDVGTYTKRIAEVHIVDASGTEVTENYNITKIDGKLVITPSSMSDSTSPKTGDNRMTGFVVAIIISALLLVGIAVAFLVTSRKRKLLTDPDPDDGGFDPMDPSPDWQDPTAPPQDWNAPEEPLWNDAQEQAWNPASQQTWNQAPEQTWDPASQQTWDQAPDQTWDAAADQAPGADFDLSWIDGEGNQPLSPEDSMPETTLDWPDEDTRKWDDPPVHIPKH